jgi:glutathione S-transferase
MNLVRQSPAHQDPKLVEQSVAQWSRMMQLLEEQLSASGGYVAGRAFTLADIPMGLSVHRWYCTPMSRPELRAIDAYYQRLKGRPAFSRLTADP